MNQTNKVLNPLDLFKQQTRQLLHDEKAFKAEFFSLPKAPDLKPGDPIKVLNIHAIVPTDDMEKDEKASFQAMQDIFHCISTSFTNSPHSLIAAMIILKDLMGTDNQFIFVEAFDPQDRPVISAIELDVPLSQGIIDCVGPVGELRIGDEVTVTQVTALDNFEEEYKKLASLSKLIFILAEKLEIVPDEDGELSQEQVTEILSFAEALGLITIGPEEQTA